jgi:hypothetical protein
MKFSQEEIATRNKARELRHDLDLKLMKLERDLQDGEEIEISIMAKQEGGSLMFGKLKAWTLSKGSVYESTLEVMKEEQKRHVQDLNERGIENESIA